MVPRPPRRRRPSQIPVYVWAPEEEGQFQPGRCSRWWLHHSLAALDRDLRALGCRMLYYRSADSRALLARLATQLGAQAVLFNHLYDPISMVGGRPAGSGAAAAGEGVGERGRGCVAAGLPALPCAGLPLRRRACPRAGWAARLPA